MGYSSKHKYNLIKIIRTIVIKRGHCFKKRGTLKGMSLFAETSRQVYNDYTKTVFE